MALRPLVTQTRVLPNGQTVTLGMAGALPLRGESGPSLQRMPFSSEPAIRSLHSGSHPYNGTWGPPVQYVEIPPGEAGTVATLKIMKKLVLGKWGHRNPEVILLAKKIVAGVSPGPRKDYRAMAESILTFMKRFVKYELDPSGLEYVQTPHFTLLNSGSGDCDDASTAICALGMALGMRAGFRTVKADPNRKQQWSHVYAVLGIQTPKGGTEWVTLDSTQPESYLGWNPPAAKIYGMKTWVIDPRLTEGDEWDS